jgi:hypothetical protein
MSIAPGTTKGPKDISKWFSFSGTRLVAMDDVDFPWEKSWLGPTRISSDRETFGEHEHEGDAESAHMTTMV